jgi:NAD(P)-dependent dehydrogenase (short-subunit alcohol dehydrogenase family)
MSADTARPTTPAARRFEGKTAIVTGAGSGIGRATAIRLAAEGASVACLDVVADHLDTTVEALAVLGAKATAYRCDVTDEQEVNSTVTDVAATLGRPDVVCNVAGIGTFAHTAEMPLADWQRILDVNLTGTFIVSKAALAHMLAPPGGNIVNVASTSGLMGAAYSAAYCASKGGVVLFTKALALEYAERGVRVNAVAPGGVDTPLIASFSLPEGADRKQIYRITSRMGFCTPDQVAAAIAFLASDESAYTTGAVLAVDGGITA